MASSAPGLRPHFCRHSRRPAAASAVRAGDAVLGRLGARGEADGARVVADGPIHGEATQELPNPAHFEHLTSSVTEDQVADALTCGPDPERHLARIREYLDAGYDRVYLHQVGPDQQGFLRFAELNTCPP